MKRRGQIRRKRRFREGKVPVLWHKGDILYEGILFGYQCVLTATDATEIAAKYGYTVQEWDEPTAQLCITDLITGKDKVFAPVWGRIPEQISEEKVKRMVREEIS